MNATERHSCPVLFLDVDGVLNRCGKSTDLLHKDKCDLLAHICKITGCKIVVSSTWRKYPHLMTEQLLPMFRARGIEHISQTPELVSERKLMDQSMLYTAKPRRAEITAWLAAHPGVTQYAIVDDDRDADDGTGRYVRTDSYEGLLDSHAAALIRILSQPIKAL